MREPERIKPILKELEKLWNLHPNMRLGQLVYVINEINNHGGDIFQVEDSQWEKWISEGIK